MAIIFYLPDQLNLSETIRSLLRQRIHADLEVSLVAIDPNYRESSEEHEHRRCREFIDFLRASLIASDPFAVVVKNDLETQWCYLGKINSAPDRAGYCFELKHKEMTALFPALVLMNRIVMLPEEFDGKLNKHPKKFLSLTRPLDFAGLELVDYRSDSEVRLAIDRVAEQFRRELKSVIHRQKLVRRLSAPDYEELAGLVKEKVAVLKAYECSPEVILTSHVKGRAVEGIPSRISVEVVNEGTRSLQNVRIRVRGPKGALASSVSKMVDLLPKAAVTVEFDLTPAVCPGCPLEVLTDLGDVPLEMPTFPIPIFVEVSASPLSSEPERIV